MDDSEDEDRFIAIGLITRGLIVVQEGLVRIISAREATRREQALFRDRMDRNR